MRTVTVDDIERAIKKREDKSRAIELKGLLATKLEVAGLSRGDLIEILGELEPLLPEIEEEFIWLNLLQDLWESPFFESRILALELMFGVSDLIDAHLWGMLDHWTNNVDSWATADWLGHVRAISIKKSPSLVTRMAPWLQTTDVWRRRSTVVSLVYIDPVNLDQKLLLGPHELFAFLEPILRDEDKNVQVALVWLFEIIRENFPDELRTYLRLHRKNLPPHLISVN